jgi:hypothetical protein
MCKDTVFISGKLFLFLWSDSRLISGLTGSAQLKIGYHWLVVGK